MALPGEMRIRIPHQEFSELHPEMPKPKKMFIAVAADPRQLVGWAEDKKRPLGFVTDPKWVAKQAIEAYKAGASMIHIHARDHKGYWDHNLQFNPDLHLELVKMIYDECPDAVFSNCYIIPDDPRFPVLKKMKKSTKGIAFTGMLDMITPGDVLPAKTSKQAEESGLKLEAAVYDLWGLNEYKRLVIEPKLVKKPYYITPCVGIHAPSIPASLESVRFMFDNLPPDNVSMLIIGGRNWIPLVAEAALIGYDGVRVGMEDTIYWRPWSDDTIQSSKDAVIFARKLIEDLGREVMTPKELRKLLAI